MACVDHHVSAGVLPPGPRYLDPDAAATGELIFEIAKGNDWPITQAAAGPFTSPSSRTPAGSGSATRAPGPSG